MFSLSVSFSIKINYVNQKKELAPRQVLQESNTQYPIIPHNNKKNAMLNVTDNSSIYIPPFIQIII